MSFVIKKNIYFLHIPKTGGNWVWKVFEKSGFKMIRSNPINKHANYDFLAGYNSSFLKIFNFNLKNKNRFFCTVRHPLTWYESFFKYLHFFNRMNFGETGKLYSKDWHILSPLNNFPKNDFNEFVKNINIKYPGFLTYLYNSYIFPTNARVLKIENLKEDLISLNKDWDLGLNLSVLDNTQKINVSNKIKINWTEENLKNTIKNEKVLFSRYNYKELPDNKFNII
ncbi:hypothetical protein [Candidatus Pelagibacter sp.]|uniref:hypothetical protein n=1 Tax=Candidatus Pelagibacter sp. TaxID=2024849 RepID=UPI003F82E6D6